MVGMFQIKGEGLVDNAFLVCILPFNSLCDIIPLEYCFSTRVNMGSSEHLAIYGDIFGCQNRQIDVRDAPTYLTMYRIALYNNESLGLKWQ